MTSASPDIKKKIVSLYGEKPPFDTIGELKEDLRKKCRKDLWFLAYHVLGCKDINNKLHKTMCKIWHKREHLENSMWLVPRSHLKTTLWTESGTIQLILRDPNHRVLITNAIADNASAMLAKIKHSFESNELLSWIFPEYDPTSVKRNKFKWSNEGLEFPCRSNRTRECNIEVLGVMKSLVSRHYDTIYFDDPVNDVNVATPEYREKVWNWFLNAWQLREDFKSHMRLIGTRWHFDDVFNRIYKINQDDVLNGDSVSWQTYIRRAIEDGKPIWPERFTLKELEKLKRRIGIYMFSCQYMNDPVPEEISVLPSSRLLAIDERDIPEEVHTFAAIDLKTDEKKAGDFNTIVVASVDIDSRVIIRHIERDRLFPTAMLERLIRIQRKYGVVGIGVETTLFMNTLYKQFRNDCRKKGIHLPFVELNRSHSTKTKRIMAIEPVLLRGDLFVSSACPKIGDLKAEMDQFTSQGSKGFDDILDCLADCVKIGFKPSTDSESHALPGTFEAEVGALESPDTYEQDSPFEVDRILASHHL